MKNGMPLLSVLREGKKGKARGKSLMLSFKKSPLKHSTRVKDISYLTAEWRVLWPASSWRSRTLPEANCKSFPQFSNVGLSCLWGPFQISLEAVVQIVSRLLLQLISLFHGCRPLVDSDRLELDSCFLAVLEAAVGALDPSPCVSVFACTVTHPLGIGCSLRTIIKFCCSVNVIECILRM